MGQKSRVLGLPSPREHTRLELCGAERRFTAAGGAGSGGSGLPAWEKGRAGERLAAPWGAGSPGGERGAGAGSAVLRSRTRAAQCQPRVTARAQHAGASPLCPLSSPFLGD